MEKYLKPELDVTEFENADIITASLRPETDELPSQQSFKSISCG